ncbi:Hsp70 family protein [Streptomyces sp. NPDC002889]|uniref:Hsp70 family protein n=1 Tax=Streptomyces sp. NPDC002889 TaxID=3364669 RepID=UPI00369706F1
MLEIENSRYLPSLVCLDADGTPLTGRAALQRAVNRPDLTERAPKRALVRQDGVILGERRVSTAELAAAVLRRTLTEAQAVHGGSAPSRTVLTHPARWGAAERTRLGEAAALAGIDGPEYLPEPVAAALHHAEAGEVPEGDCLAVYDLGGGTFDTAVLRRTSNGFTTVAVGGDPHLGGEDLDECLAALLAERAEARDPLPWDELWGSAEPGQVAQRALLRRELTAAKEALSTASSVDLAVPGYPEPFLIRSHEYRSAVEPLLARSHDLLTATVREAGLEPAALHAVVLTGGASRTPRVSDLIAEREQRLPLLTADPKASVVLGALSSGLVVTVPAEGPADAGARPGEPRRALRYFQPAGDPDFEFSPYD